MTYTRVRNSGKRRQLNEVQRHNTGNYVYEMYVMWYDIGRVKNNRFTTGK